MDYLDLEDNGLLHFRNGLQLNDLVSDNGTVFEVNFNDCHEEENDSLFDPKQVLDHVNSDCLGLHDEDVYSDGEPFEQLATKMIKVLDDGKILKRILREGYGDLMTDLSMITFDFNAYLEYNDEPFDSSYLRKAPATVPLRYGSTLPGLDIALSTMKLSEKSQFLIHPDYAYAPLGCTPRVPENATVLFEIEIKNVIDGALNTFPLLGEEQQKSFSVIYKYSLALCTKAKELYCHQSYKQAVKEYNVAASKLESCILMDYDEQLKQQELLLRIRTNLVIGYTKMEEPRRACANANRIFNMCKKTSLQISSKVYFNHARSLMLLGDYESAEAQLNRARKREPENPEISKQLSKLNEQMKEVLAREADLVKAMFGNSKFEEKDQVSRKFNDSMVEYCKELIRDKESTQYILPEKLTKTELYVTRQIASDHKLQVKPFMKNNEKYYISKVPV